MKYLKILYQSNDKTPPFYKQVFLKNYIVGENGYSYAIQYSPQSYNSWLSDEKIFRVFVDSTVKQLIINNYKFLHLIYIQDKLNLTLVDCDFKNIDTDDLLEGKRQIVHTYF
ncbi:hypothetical protein [Paucisalibacillus globulus]|uniref:hypothetical protein n=1 Tax=Paucisalibacillus globulus TaxID=351095 RepID=UPI000BB86877|nr:hypothetical protein [Paucisalibacillus globulus]